MQINEGNVQEFLEKDGTKLLAFTATWCGPCKMVKPVLEELSNEGHSIGFIDVDDNTSLAQEWGIRSVPTIISVPENGDNTKLIGAQTRAKLVELLEA